MAAHNVVGNDNLKSALLEMQELAAYSNCRDYLYHASINPKEGEKLNPQQWAKSITELEKNLDLTGHQRAIVKHVKDGREHVHVVWSRIDPQTLTAKQMSWNYVQHEKTARALEREFSFERVQGAHVEKDGPRPDRGPKQKDKDKTRRQSLPAHKVKAEVSKLWEQSDSGKAFVAALHDAGYLLARGDKKPFVIVDEKGGIHGLVRRIEDRTAAAMEKMADVDPANLPTVTRAKEMQEEREKIHQSHKTGQSYERQDMTSQQTAAMKDLEKHFKERQEQQQKEAAQGNTLEKEKSGDRKKEKGDIRAERGQQAQEQQKRERAEKESREQYNQLKGGSTAARPKNAADEILNRTERTDRQREKKHEDKLKELFEKSFKGSADAASRAFDRERTRER